MIVSYDDAMETATLERIVEPVSRCLTPEVARQIVALRAEPELEQRVEELACKADNGQLTEAERDEYESYVRASKFISILQSKARALLSRPLPYWSAVSYALSFATEQTASESIADCPTSWNHSHHFMSITSWPH